MTKKEQLDRAYGYQLDPGSAVPEDGCKALLSSAPQPPLYYYTTVETFQKIMETGSLFASHIKRMNDWKEFDIGAAKVISDLEAAIEGRWKDIKASQTYADSYKRVSQEIVDLAQEKELTQAEELCNYYRVPFLKGAIQRCGRNFRHLINNDLQMYRFGNNGVYDMDYAFPELYSISFTTQKDLLSQWKMYAQESGVAIEFDFAGMGSRLVLKQGVSINGKDGKDFPVPCRYPQPVKYEMENNPLPLEDSLDVKKLFSDVPYYKDPAFSQESEARLIFRPYKMLKGDTLMCSKTGYRTANHLLIPYLVIYCVDKNSPESLGWPITSLTVGPGHNQDVVFEGLIHFVEYGQLKMCRFTDEEQMQARIRYYYEFLTESGMLDATSGSSSWDAAAKQEITQEKAVQALEQERCLFHLGKTYAKTDHYEQLFQEFCDRSYLATNGLIVRKSKIPYIFS